VTARRHAETPAQSLLRGRERAGPQILVLQLSRWADLG
jgi:hypothetical protein